MLEIVALRKSWPRFDLALDLELGDGRIGVVLGPSGCGKSTLLRMVAGLTAPDGGRIVLNGTRLDGLPPEKRGLGMVFQDLALFSHMSVRRNIEYGLRMLRTPRRRRDEIVLDLARSFGIEALLRRWPGSLSGGERQRVALARTLAPGPALILLDEPLSALDLELRRRLRLEIAQRLRAAGVMALHVTHDVDEAFAIADLVYLMAGGRIVERGTAEELYERPRSAFTARFLGRGPLLNVVGLAGGPDLPLIRTALGEFRCRRPKASARWAPGGRESLFFPADSAELVGDGEEATTGADLPHNHFSGRVLESDFAGRFRRVLLSCGGDTGGAARVSIELEFPREFRPVQGEELHLRVPEERCILLPEEPDGGGAEEAGHARTGQASG